MDSRRRTLTRRCATLSVALTLALIAALTTSCGGGGSVSNINLPKPEKASTGVNHFLIWVNWHDCVGLSNADLQKWKGRGAGGFICETEYLDGMGGTNAFTGSSGADLSGSQYEIQQALESSRVVERARNLGMSMYLAFYLANLHNSRTPLEGWFDNRGWASEVVPRVRELASAARLLGFTGVAIDQELYTAEASGWVWNYQGNTHSQRQVRTEAKRRGQQLMRALLSGFPNVAIVTYDSQFPGMIFSPSSNTVQINFWDGMTSVDGYRQILMLDSTFYKDPGLDGATWDSALQYQYNTVFSVLSQRLSNWAYASSRIFETPFGWINGDEAREGPYAAVRPPGYVAEQLQAFAQWSMAGTFGIYSYKQLDAFNYRPYVPALRAATSTTTADQDPPAVVVQRPTRSPEYQAQGRSSITISGYATDPFAIRAVYWTTDQGRSGAAVMTWARESGSPAVGWHWKMMWSAKIPLQSGANHLSFIAVSTKGPTGQAELVVES